MNKIILYFLLCVGAGANSQSTTGAWIADKGDGTYKNPVINADYSDPDAIRVGDDYYMVSSSFNHVPGLPILHSRDLVNWKLIGHALKRITPVEHFSQVQHGGGVWAPSIRYHNNEFCIYYPDPDFGIYLTRAKNINGPWSDPVLVEGGKGLIDPCPLWDDDGRVYLVHAYAGSRAGIKSILVVKEMNKEGTKTISDAVMVYDGHLQDPTIEGPKFYKRKNYYYLFAPAGGVSTGWQLVLRSKNIYGPYERKVVMDQGTSNINGPHQGAWVATPGGEDWFLHFQDKDAYGRVVHLQPMKWVNDWPVIGSDKDGDGKGEPVFSFKKPSVGKTYPIVLPAETDEFNSTRLGFQWQWQANPGNNWAFATAHGTLRLFAVKQADSLANCWSLPNILAQKFPAETFEASLQFKFSPATTGERMGLIVLGLDYALISVLNKNDGFYISYSTCEGADKGKAEKELFLEKISGNNIGFRLSVATNATCRFSYRTGMGEWKEIPGEFKARPGKWVGAKMGVFYSRRMVTNDGGYADIDWFRVEPRK